MTRPQATLPLGFSRRHRYFLHFLLKLPSRSNVSFAFQQMIASRHVSCNAAQPTENVGPAPTPRPRWAFPVVCLANF